MGMPHGQHAAQPRLSRHARHLAALEHGAAPGLAPWPSGVLAKRQGSILCQARGQTCTGVHELIASCANKPTPAALKLAPGLQAHVLLRSQYGQLQASCWCSHSHRCRSHGLAARVHPAWCSASASAERVNRLQLRT